jgi:ABC-type Fe3+/spermidine/putrescine transport system ATPase subunit
VATPLALADSSARDRSAVPRLELSNLHKSLGGNPVVQDLHLSIAAGESVVLLGPSGCGKTTTLRMVAGFLQPDSGRIIVDGRIVSGEGVTVPTERRRLGMVFQNYAVWPHKTVFDNVAYGLVVARRARREIADRVRVALDTVQLSGYEKRFPGELSGGQQQRVALARAIVTEPSLLLLDEPLSNLDAALRQEMRFELKALHRKTGMTTLYVTHDQEEALVLADRIAVLKQGRIEQLGTPEDIYQRPRTAFVAHFVGGTNLLHGKVERIDAASGRLQVDIGLGAPIRASGSAAHIAGVAVGDDITVAIRPEDVLLGGAARPFDNTPLAAHLDSVVFLGGRYEVGLKLGAQSCRCHVRTLPDAMDDGVEIRFDPDRAWIVAS